VQSHSQLCLDHAASGAHGLTALHPISPQPYNNFTRRREDEASNHNRGIK